MTLDFAYMLYLKLRQKDSYIIPLDQVKQSCAKMVCSLSTLTGRYVGSPGVCIEAGYIRLLNEKGVLLTSFHRH